MSSDRHREHSLNPSVVAVIGILFLCIAACSARGLVVGGLFAGAVLIGYSLMSVWNYDYDVFYWEHRRKIAGFVGFLLIVAACAGFFLYGRS